MSMTSAIPEPADRREAIARDRLGKALRDLGHDVVGHRLHPTQLEEIASELEAINARIERTEARGRTSTTTSEDWPGDTSEGAVQRSHGDRPFCGSSSPWGVDMVVTREADEAVARMTLRAAHEGAPARAHGGIVAGIMDDVLGFVLQIHHRVAFTGTLSVRYENPTPLFVPLVYRARLAREEGRKLYLTGDSWDGDKKLVSAEAVFISVPPAMLGH